MTKQFSNYADLLTFTRASKGHALRPVSYGDELVTNGTFDDSSALDDWEEFSGTLSVVSQKLRVTQTTGSNPSAGQTVNTTVGKIYVLSLDYFPDDANAQILVKSTNINGSILYNEQNLTSDGTYRNVFVATKSSIYIQLVAQSSTTGHYAEFDNVSLKEVTFDQPDGTLTLFEHPDNVPRVEYDADGNRLGLLVEESRTNLDTASDFFAGGGGVTATKNYIAPDKTLSASTLSYNGALTPYINATNIAFTSGTTYTFSFFFKRGTGTQNVQTLLYGSAFNNGGANCVVIYDLDAETSTVASGSFTAHSVTNIGNGWYRCSCSSTATATISQNQQIYRAGTADDGNYDYIWGKQVEAGSFPTSYIKTTGSTATRSADVASIPVADFGYNHNEGTVFAEFSGQFNESGTLFPRPYEISGGNSSADRITVYFAESSGNLAAEVRNNNVQSAGFVLQTGVSSNFTAIKTAFAFKADDFAATEDGDTPVTDTAGTFTPSTPRDELALMATVTGSQTLNGHLKSIKYYPRRLTNAQLQDITS